MKKNIKLMILMLLMLIILTGCGIQTGNYLTAETATGWWQTWIILPLIQVITWLSETIGSVGLAIIIATILSRLIALPFTLNQAKSTAKRNGLSPEVEKIKRKYESKADRESGLQMQQEINLMYKENGINMTAGCLPLLIQMPMMMAFFQAFSRHPLIAGSEIAYFLGLNLASVNMLPNYVFAILVAFSMYYSGKRTQGANSDQTTKNMDMMNIPMAMMMGSFVVFSPLAMGLYFLVSQIMTSLQGYLIKKPVITKTMI